jgi:lipoprotein-anchoring transpeptidase ErfK/SrfK
MKSLQYHMVMVGVVMMGYFMVSCAPTPPRQPMKAQYVMYQWYEDFEPGEISVEINLKEQMARVKRGGREIGWAFVATGIEGRRTPAGSYRVTEKIVDKYSNKYGWIENEFGEVVNDDATPGTRLKPGEVYMPAPMPYWMRLTDYGIGMHVGKIPKPGDPASHGCIRMPEEFVPTLFDKVKIGTPVKIRY